jgi:hypothetical protein
MVSQLRMVLSPPASRNVDSAELVRLDISHARPFIEHWHYSGRVPTGQNFFWGWFFNGELYAVANYGIGVNPYQADFLARESGKAVTLGNLVELKRLCRIEPRNETLPLTAFISRCHKALRSMGYRFVVSFSDPEYAHTGGIYKASSFTHMGLTNPEVHLVDRDGNKRHRRLAFRYARRKGIEVPDARTRLGLSRQKTEPKDRWFKTL